MTRPTRPPTDAPTARLHYLPALDGLRGACLLAVLLFHSGFAWMSGGFLGVSTFFTLSGFLITSLLVAEQAETGTVALRRFWGRRLRRLLPASTLTVVAIVTTGRFWLAPAQRERLAEDGLATLFSLANLRFMRPEYAYDRIFTDPSPLQHFWSLAIEGQFYLVFPVVAALLLRRGGARALGVACALVTAASIAVALATPSLEEAQHRLYYGTDARCGELLIGALLALGLRRARGRELAAARGAQVAGALAALLLVVAWSRATVADAWLYRGGFAAYAVLSALVIVAATASGSFVQRALSPGWLRWLGTVSYGAYLYHWPIFQILTHARTGLPPAALLVVRLAATLVLAWLSYRFVELPIRRATLLPGRRFARVAVAALFAASILASATNPLLITADAIVAYRTVRGVLTGDDGTADANRTRIIMIGDSTALALWNGVRPWLREDGRAVPGDGWFQLGCGVVNFGQIENRGQWQPQPLPCQDFVDTWSLAVREQRADVVVVLVGPWEARTRRRNVNAAPEKLGDPDLDRATRDAIAAGVERIVAAGAGVVWLTAPHIEVPPLDGESFQTDRDASEPARMDRLNELIREVAAQNPATMRVIDLAGHLQTLPGGELDPEVRPDGVHFSRAGALGVARGWLGDEILRAASELRRPGEQPRAEPPRR